MYSGAEKVLEQMVRCYPASDIFTLVDLLSDEQRARIGGASVQTSFIQRLPFVRKQYRSYLPLFPLAIEQFDLSEYDLVLSSNFAVAKGVVTSCEQLHVSYTHTPIRYAWEMQFQYLREAGLERGVRSGLARAIMHYLRRYDVSTANRVDVYLANSAYVARRIWKAYRRKSTVVYPPVYTDRFKAVSDKDDYYLTASRLVPYKRVRMIVEAFNQMPDKRLVVFGGGPELNSIRRMAGPNVDVMGHQPFEVLKSYMERAQAFVYAAQEDFGIVAVEAQACGTPVIAYGKGGVQETVIDGETGLLYTHQSAEALRAAVTRFEQERDRFEPERLRHHAERFSVDRFTAQFEHLVSQAWDVFQKERRNEALEGFHFDLLEA